MWIYWHDSSSQLATSLLVPRFSCLNYTPFQDLIVLQNKSFAGSIRLCWIINENDYEHCTTCWTRALICSYDGSWTWYSWHQVPTLLNVWAILRYQACVSVYDSRLIAKAEFLVMEWKNDLMEEWFAWFPVEKRKFSVMRLLEICCWRGRIKLNFKERSLLLEIRLGVKKESLSKKYVRKVNRGKGFFVLPAKRYY